jgi:hypothetical protein
VERRVVLDQRPARPRGGKSLRVGDSIRGLDPVELTARGDHIERPRIICDRAEADARAVRRGRYHAGHRLTVVAAHVRQCQAERIEVRVQLADADARLDANKVLLLGPFGPQQILFELERSCEPRREQQEAAGERHVRPRVAGADGAYGATGSLRLLHERNELLERGRLLDPQGIDALVAGVVAPLAAQAEGQPAHRRRTASLRSWIPEWSPASKRPIQPSAGSAVVAAAVGKPVTSTMLVWMS